MNIVEMHVDELIPYINNPRKNDDSVDAVASSIKNFGFRQPIVVDKGREIIVGHTRLKAAKKLGMETVPVIIADDLTDAQIKAYRLADNKVGELAEWDFETLEKELSELKLFELDFKMEDFGFKPIKEDDSAEIKERKLKPFLKVHYLISANLNKNDEILKIIDQLKDIGGVEVESSLN